MTQRLRDLLVPASIFALAFGLRLIHLADLSSLPTFHHPLMDPQYHDQWAREIARGEFGARPVFFRAPLYPYALGALYALFGAGPWIPRIVQAILGSLTCLLVASLASRIFCTRTATIGAGLLAAASWTLIYFDGELLVEPLFVCLTLASIRLAIAGLDRPSLLREGGAGLLLGLAAITRPTILPFSIVLALAPVTPGRKDRLRVAAALLGAMALVILPVTLHNLLRGGDLVLIASQGGVNFFIGNNAASDGTTAIVPGTRPTWQGGREDTVRLAEAAAGRPLRPSEVSRYWYGRGWEFILGSPGAALALTLRKAALLWNAFEIGNNEDFADLRSRLHLLSLPLPGFGVVAPLGVAGLFLALLRPPVPALRAQAGARAPALILAGFVAVHSAVTVAFFVNSRYRMPLLAALCVPAGGAIAAVVEGALSARAGLSGDRHGARRRALAVVITLAVVAPLVNVNWYNLRPNPGIGRHLMGIAYEEAGSPEEALAEFRAASMIPENSLAHASLTEAGNLLLRLGRRAEAEDSLRRAVAIAPADLDARSDLAASLFQRGDLGGARAQMEAALRMGGASALDPEAWYRLGLIRQAQNDAVGAIDAYGRALALDPSRAEAHTNLALVLRGQGRTAEALEHLRAAASAAPDLAPARSALAMLLYETGDVDGAREQAARARALGAVIDPGLAAALAH